MDEPELIAAATEEQAARQIEDGWDSPIQKWLGDRTDTSINEILEHALSVSTEKIQQSDANRVATCLKRLGWERYRVGRQMGRGTWRYRLPVPSVPTR
jgi:hypothetical protein